MPSPERTALYFKDGSSDKEYHVHLVERDGGWAVDFQYGRRGQALRSGTKTKSPLDYAAAKACYDKVVNGQLREGYTPSEGGVAYQNTANEALFTGIVPQLQNPLDAENLDAFVRDPDTWAQEKYNGERRLIRRNGAAVEGINRTGLLVSLPRAFESAALFANAAQFVIDGEDLGDRVAVFDLLELNGADLRPQPYSERLERLAVLLADAGGALVLAGTARTAAEKQALLDRVAAESGEGVVFKAASAPYIPGRPASGGSQHKFKFTESATVRVAQVHPTKRSVAMELHHGDGIPVKVGNVTIPVNHDVPPAGALIEVTYLYAYPGGSLYQPVYGMQRTDMTWDDCRVAQLKMKPGAEPPPAPAAKKRKRP